MTDRPETTTEEPDFKTILLQLIGSLTLADHLGDVSEDISYALSRAGIDIEWEDLSDLGASLGEMGVTTLYGSTLGRRNMT